MKDLSSLCSDNSDMNTEFSWKIKLPVRVGSELYSTTPPIHRNISSGLQKRVWHIHAASVSKGFYSQLLRMRHKYLETEVSKLLPIAIRSRTMPVQIPVTWNKYLHCKPFICIYLVWLFSILCVIITRDFLQHCHVHLSFAFIQKW